MPIYEYQCSGCGHVFELLEKMNDIPTKTCPECSKDSAKRIVSPAGFHLKGTGWYATDFKDKGKPEKKSDSSTSSSESTKSATKVTKDSASSNNN